jgi:hypothetical protein
MFHSPTLAASYSAIAISTNEITSPEELIERVVSQVFIEVSDVNFKNQNIRLGLAHLTIDVMM